MAVHRAPVVTIRATDRHRLLPGAPDAAVTELAGRIQQEPPYSYQPGEIAPATDWFPPLVAKARLALVALVDGVVAGYCVSLPVETYGKLGDLLPRLDLDPATTEYFAELGVDGSVRRQGVASALLDRFHESLPATTTSVLIRTLADNTAAIAFYLRHGYEVADGVGQVWHGRPRVLLLRHVDRSRVSLRG